MTGWSCPQPWNTVSGLGIRAGTDRNLDLDLFYGHVLSGTSGLHPAYTDTPSGGLGFSPAFPQGPSLKKLAEGEPISIDLAACVNGYVVDMTRMYALGGLPQQAWEAWRLVEELYRLFESEARPGVMPGKIFHRVWDLVGPWGKTVHGSGHRPGQFPGPRGGPGIG
jgi:Xaa-Pro dipeptidase